MHYIRSLFLERAAPRGGDQGNAKVAKHRGAAAGASNQLGLERRPEPAQVVARWE